jgi:hypothetical protein
MEIANISPEILYKRYQFGIYLKSPAVFIDKHPKLVKKMLHLLPAIEHEANENEASITMDLLVSQAKFLVTP